MSVNKALKLFVKDNKILFLGVVLKKNNRMKKLMSVVLFSALGGALTLGAYKMFIESPQIIIEKEEAVDSVPIKTNFTNTVATAVENTNFTVAAEKTINTVVHVKNTSYKSVRDPYAEYFYGRGRGSKQYQQIGTGSGVVISSDGYIITNSHVIKNATEIEVILNNKKMYKATLIGADATNDVALLKVNAKNLPYISFGNSDAIKVGEWVLAVGNPYNLTSTVTAGIVSAKGRDLKGNKNIESFIQTDAAVNSGNSGGALVNVRGELIGVNTAISSGTGAFVGYSFAIPSNIAKKVVEDLMEFGNVQKAMLGVQGGELNSKLAENLTLNHTEGFYISEVTKNSGAEKAGLQAKDIIVKIDQVHINTYADLTGFLRTKRPSDTVEVTFLRNGKEQKTKVVLSENKINMIAALGLELKNISAKELQKSKLSHGVKITGISNKQLKYYGVKKGYIITAIGGKKVTTVDDVNYILQNNSENEILRIEMLNLKGEKERYVFR